MAGNAWNYFLLPLEKTEKINVLMELHFKYPLVCTERLELFKIQQADHGSLDFKGQAAAVCLSPSKNKVVKENI